MRNSGAANLSDFIGVLHEIAGGLECEGPDGVREAVGIFEGNGVLPGMGDPERFVQVRTGLLFAESE